ncbi:MAG: amidohydrolase family protein [Rhodospirillales bacterium]|nr:amidohydrolase family protein [Rhodospirillales bacterium]
MNNPLLLKFVRPMAGEAVDISIVDGKIAQIGISIDPPKGDATVIDGTDLIAVPGFVDAHTHMDKTFLGLPWQPHSAGPTIREKVDNETRLLRTLNLDTKTQSEKQARLHLSKGTTHVRTHVDVGAEQGLTHLEGILATREAFAGLLSMQIVAFPQQGLITNPGTVELMEEAVRMGAEFVGGIDPSVIERDPVRHLDTVFGIAERCGVGVDIHLHEPAELGAFSVELICERTKALGMAGNVTISHAFCLGMVDDGRLAGLLDQLATNDISIMTHAPGAIPFPPVSKLAEAGVRICSGSDGIRDAWNPYGNADMLERAMILSYRNNFRRDDELERMLDICSFGGASVMGAEDYGLKVGCAADIVLMEGETLAEAIVTRAPRRLVLKAGRTVAENGNCVV